MTGFNTCRRDIAVLLLFFFTSFSYAQTVKTGVLVVGGNASGVAAAIQASRSGVKTVLLAGGETLGGDITSSSTVFKGGIYDEFMKRVRELKNDSAALTDPATTAVVLKALTDTVKHLTVRYGTTWEKIEKSGRGWEVKLAGKNGTIKADAVVDAMPEELLASSAGSAIDPETKLRKTATPQQLLSDLYTSSLYRTSVAVGVYPETGEPYLLPLGALIASGVENLFVTGRLASRKGSPDAMSIGQAAGAAASFFSFYDTSTQTLNVNMPTRAIQAELQRFGSRIFPVMDIRREDPDFFIIEHIALTGILKVQKSGSGFLYNPDSAVYSGEVKTALKSYYSRSQIWYADHPGVEKFTLGDMLSLIKYLGHRGNELDKEVEKGWETTFLFKGKFDLQHVLTRREFAVLTELLLQPFAVRVNLIGNPGN
jgi:hypothetical protein